MRLFRQTGLPGGWKDHLSTKAARLAWIVLLEMSLSKPLNAYKCLWCLQSDFDKGQIYLVQNNKFVIYGNCINLKDYCSEKVKKTKQKQLYLRWLTKKINLFIIMSFGLVLVWKMCEMKNEDAVCCSSVFEWARAVVSTTHPNVLSRQPASIVENGGAKFRLGRRGCGIKHMISLTQQHQFYIKKTQKTILAPS